MKNNLNNNNNNRFAQIFAVVFIVSSTLLACTPSSGRVDNAQENVKEAEIELKKAKAEYAEDVRKFKLETDKRIEANHVILRDINDQYSRSSKKVDQEYVRQADNLEEKNEVLKQRMREYKADSKESWKDFKVEFNRDMDELGTALKNLTVDNK